jgi:hypothetical protein
MRLSNHCSSGRPSLRSGALHGRQAPSQLGAGDVTMVSTSELRNPLAVPVDVPPRDAVSLSITSRTGALPSRTTSPHDTHADTTAAMPEAC